MAKTLESIEVPEDVLERAMRRAQTDSPAAAVNKALQEYARFQARDELIAMLGTSDTFITLEELMDMRENDE